MWLIEKQNGRVFFISGCINTMISPFYRSADIGHKLPGIAKLLIRNRPKHIQLQIIILARVTDGNIFDKKQTVSNQSIYDYRGSVYCINVTMEN